MNRYFISLLIVLAAVGTALTQFNLERLLQDEWSAFKITYNKTYSSPQEENFRREIYIENRNKITLFNQEYAQGKRSFVQQFNPFGDMLHHEFHQALNGFNRTRVRVAIPTPSTFIPSANVPLPTHVDWRELGAVTSVKNQGTCAGCWAFAAAGALEGQNYRKTGRLIDLSAQNLIDCSTSFGNDGCEGGLMAPAYEYVKQNPGLDIEAPYPYEARNAECRFREPIVGAYCSGYVSIPSGDEKGLETAVATMGPVSVAIDAGPASFQFYSDGIFYDPACRKKSEEMNHGVLVVGYGAEPNGNKYWLIKNSYGPQWGNGGYMKLAKDRNNHCGIATEAVFPLV